MKSLRFLQDPSVLVALAGVIYLLFEWNMPGLGALPGNDDMMRLQQVRDLMAGQGWFEVDQARLLTPEGGAMHWSRIPDVFLVGLTTALTPLIGVDMAEHIAISVWPITLFIASIVALIASAKALKINKIGAAIAIAALILSSAMYQYWPGRIDHHGAVATCVLVCFAALLQPAERRRSGLILAIAMSLMLSMAIESLPFVALCYVALGVFYVWRGTAECGRCVVFGGASVVFAGLLFILDAPGLSNARNTCDAFGLGHLAGVFISGLGFIAFGAMGQKLKTSFQRFAALTMIGASAAFAAYLVSPHCLGSPYANLSTQVTENWLKTIGEARSINVVFQQDIAQALTHFGFILAGLVAAGFCIGQSKGDTQVKWAVLMLFLITAALLTAWQSRAVVFAHIFAVLPVGHILADRFSAYRRTGGVPALLVFAVTVAALMPMSWRLVGPVAADIRQPHTGVQKAAACEDGALFENLNTYAPARIFAPIDTGASVLVSSHHFVFAAPYHRNPEGITAVIDTFLTSPENAVLRMRQMGADYLLYCRGGPETVRYARFSPSGLAGALEQGRELDGLRRITPQEPSEAGYILYEISG